jgi:hypothetical protein
MAWSASKIFASYVVGTIDRTALFDIDTDALLVALYNNTPTPDNTVTLANSAYNVGQWATAQEVSQAGQWAPGGVALASRTVVAAATTITFDAADTASGAAATLANVFGCEVYDNTLTPKAGVCYNYFGGSNSVTAGTFTVVWNSSGIFTISVA